MNQHLIDQLLHKAGARFGAEGIDYSSFTSSKFAELIVKETLQIARVGMEFGPSMEEAVYTYFGVKE